MLKAEKIHSGQYKKYGDYFIVFDIKTDESEDSVIDYCFSQLRKGSMLPTKEEWSANIRYGAKHFADTEYYYHGYYTLIPVPRGYVFTICEPYTD